jgi:hypothetical protein
VVLVTLRPLWTLQAPHHVGEDVPSELSNHGDVALLLGGGLLQDFDDGDEGVHQLFVVGSVLGSGGGGCLEQLEEVGEDAGEVLLGQVLVVAQQVDYPLHYRLVVGVLLHQSHHLPHTALHHSVVVLATHFECPLRIAHQQRLVEASGGQAKEQLDKLHVFLLHGHECLEDA